MAYPTNTLALVLEDVDRRAVSVKSYATRYHDQMAAGNVLAGVVIDLYIRLKADRAAFASAATVPGLGAYAQSQKNDPSLDIAHEFTSMNAAIDGVIAWITTNFPKDASGYLLRSQWGPDGPVDRSFTPAQTTGLQTALTSLIATIA